MLRLLFSSLANSYNCRAILLRHFKGTFLCLLVALEQEKRSATVIVAPKRI